MFTFLFHFIDYLVLNRLGYLKTVSLINLLFNQLNFLFQISYLNNCSIKYIIHLMLFGLDFPFASLWHCFQLKFNLLVAESLIIAQLIFQMTNTPMFLIDFVFCALIALFFYLNKAEWQLIFGLYSCLVWESICSRVIEWKRKGFFETTWICKNEVIIT